MKNTELIATMKQVAEVSAALHSTSWIWGGMVADIYQGQILREHHDLDYLTLHLHELIEPLSSRFEEVGWSTQHLSNGDLKLEKGEVKVHLGHVAISQDVCWTHNGDLGSLYFPVEWLVQEEKKFYDLCAHAVAPELQYTLLEYPQLLNPDWLPREKDHVAKAYLKTLLEEKNIIVDNLRSKIHD
jgi:hypothetical protein